MWSSNRRTALLGLAAVLAGCGFTPAYGPRSTGGRLIGAVELATPETDNGYTLRQRLQDHIGPLDEVRYTLAVKLAASEDQVAVTTQGSTRRYNVIGTAIYTLTDRVTGTVEAEGKVSSFTSYAATGTTAATLAAERDAYRRLMVILADEIMDRLLLASPEVPA